jgi:hypothetical protein
MANRIQSRRGNGRFQKPTLANTFGLGNEICSACGQMHPFSLGVCRPPAECESCGEYLLWYVEHVARTEAAQDRGENPAGL